MGFRFVLVKFIFLLEFIPEHFVKLFILLWSYFSNHNILLTDVTEDLWYVFVALRGLHDIRQSQCVLQIWWKHRGERVCHPLFHAGWVCICLTIYTNAFNNSNINILMDCINVCLLVYCTVERQHMQQNVKSKTLNCKLFAMLSTPCL